MSNESFEIRGVEIFRSGTWNGDTYSDEDLDAIVDAARGVGFTPPLKAGHEDARGRPALGWVERLRRIGSTLVADLVGLPGAVYDAIRQRRFDRVSSEIFWDLERNGKTFRRVLKAVALLGAEIPAVDLQPLAAAFRPFTGGDMETVKTYVFPIAMDYSQLKRAEVGAELDRRVKARIFAEGGDPTKDYKQALDAVLAADADLKAAYAGS